MLEVVDDESVLEAERFFSGAAVEYLGLAPGDETGRRLDRFHDPVAPAWTSKPRTD